MPRRATTSHTGPQISTSMATVMPPGGAESRAEQLATLSVLAHELLTTPELEGLLDGEDPGAISAATEQLGRHSEAFAARRLLLAAAEWDPKGATGYRYNDEAGMPFAYYAARTYTWIHDHLSEEERALQWLEGLVE